MYVIVLSESEFNLWKDGKAHINVHDSNKRLFTNLDDLKLFKLHLNRYREAKAELNHNILEIPIDKIIENRTIHDESLEILRELEEKYDHIDFLDLLTYKGFTTNNWQYNIKNEKITEYLSNSGDKIFIITMLY